MAKKKGRDLTLTWGGTKIGNITDISLSIDGEIINVSDFDSGEWNDKLAGSKDWTMDVSVYHNPEDDSVQETLEGDMFTAGRSDDVVFGPETPASGDITYGGTVIISNMSVDASGRDEAITSSFTFEGNGALTRTVTA